MEYQQEAATEKNQGAEHPARWVRSILLAWLLHLPETGKLEQWLGCCGALWEHSGEGRLVPEGGMAYRP